MEYSTIFEISELAFNISLLYWIRNSLNISKVFVINIITSFMIFIISFIILYLQIKPKLFFSSFKNYIKEIVLFWKGAFFLDLLSKAQWQFDRLIIGKFLSVSSVSLFHVQAKISECIKKIIAIPLLVFSPEITHRFEQKRGDLLGSDLVFFTKLQFILGVFLTTLVFSLSKEFILFVSNKEYLSGQIILVLISSSLPLLSFATPVITTLKAIGKIHTQLIYDIFWVTSYLISGLILIFFWGLKGIAFAHLIASLTVFIYTLFVIRKETSFKFSQIQISKIIIISLLAFIINLVIKKIVHLPNLIIIIFIGVISLILFVSFLVFFKVFNEKDKEKLISFLSFAKTEKSS